MPKQSVNKPFISVRDKKMMLENEHYRKFTEEKEEIRNKYDKRIFYNTGIRSTIKHNKWFCEEGRWEYRKYLNEIYDVMMRVDSDFGKFVEAIEPEMDSKKRGRYI
jgi:hypothetical protein